MNTKTAVNPPEAIKPLGPYSHAIASDPFLYCSGQVPIDPAKPMAPLPEDIRGQTTRVLENIRILLAARGLDFRHVVKSTVFMTNLAEFEGMNEVYAAFFPAPYPARSTVQVSALPRGAKVEIEVIARGG